MRYRRLGQSSLEVPLISFGAWAIGGTYWGGTDDEAAVEAILRGIDIGVTAIDTAPIYGFGHSEKVVGRAIAGRRGEVLVLTKAGLRWEDEGGRHFFDSEDNEGRKRSVFANSRPESVRHEVEQSLARLGIDRIDLLQIHWPDPTTPIADTMGALLELRAEGKIREIGVSNYSTEQMDEARAALGEVPLASDQPKYSLVAREIEADVLPYARRHQIGTLVYSPLEQGLLSGRVGADRTFAEKDGRNARPSFLPENRAKVNAALESTVKPIAATHSATMAQTVLAWTLAQEGVTSALVGARSPEQVTENAAAGDLELTPEELRRIRRTFEGLDLESRGAVRRILKKLFRSS